MRSCLGISIGLALFFWTPLLSAAPPAVTHLFPAGVQRGKTAAVTAFGTLDKWPVELWVDRPGIKVTLAAEKGKLDVTADVEASPGVYWLRLFDGEGAAGLRPLVVGTLAELVEKEPNDRTSEANVVAAPMTVNGQLGARGDVDTYAVEARRGQTLVAAIMANETLGSPMDASLQILSADGFVLAQNDDDAGFDPLLVFQAPADGRYLIRTFAFPAVADSSINYAGDPKYVYRLTVTTGGYLDHAFPLAVSRGGPVEIRPGGWNLAADLLLKPALPEFPAEGPVFGRVELLPVWQADVAGQAAARIVPAGAVLEQEPNDPAKPQMVSAPAYVSGRLGEAKDTDTFRLEAKKGAKYEIKAEARGIGSPVDAVLKVLAADGKALAQADDAKDSRDASLVFAVPADGAYTIEVADLHRRGGPRFYYLLSIEPATPDFALTTAAESFSVALGKTVEIAVTVEREQGYAGDLEISAVDLPEGVSAPAVKSVAKDPSGKSVKLVLKADRAPYTGPLSIVGKSTGDGAAVRRARAPLAGLGISSGALWLTVTATEKKEEKKEPEKK